MMRSMGFNAQTAAQITGLKEDRIRYWARTEVLRPSLVYEPGTQYGYLYSFQDIVSLRTLRNLRDQYDFSLQSLRRIGEWLRDQVEHPWATLRFFTDGERLAFSDDERRLVSASQPGQIFLEPVVIPLQAVRGEMEERARQLRQRDPEDVGKIERRRLVFQRKPTIAGTRIPTEVILEYLELGYSPAEIIKLYPTLTPDDVVAVVSAKACQRHLASAS